MLFWFKNTRYLSGGQFNEPSIFKVSKKAIMDKLITVAQLESSRTSPLPEPLSLQLLWNFIPTETQVHPSPCRKDH